MSHGVEIIAHLEVPVNGKDTGPSVKLVKS
jgi:hypothetical protein